jgi:hypothetical protein
VPTIEPSRYPRTRCPQMSLRFILIPYDRHSIPYDGRPTCMHIKRTEQHTEHRMAERMLQPSPVYHLPWDEMCRQNHVGGTQTKKMNTMDTQKKPVADHTAFLISFCFENKGSFEIRTTTRVHFYCCRNYVW